MSATPESKKDIAARLAKYRTKFWSTDVSIVKSWSTPGQNRVRGENGGHHLLSWRNNLTVLSQRYNLYVVAYEDEIHVSRTTPTGLCETPMQIRLTPSRPGLPGHMPGSRPHAINNLIVSDFGYDEIICIACDDGDIMAVYTHSLEHMMQEHEDDLQSKNNTKPGSPPQSDLPDVYIKGLRALLHVNLGITAWGIAVHKEGRLIAASCNDHKVYVFAPALTSGAFDVESLYNQDSPALHAHWTLSPYHTFLGAGTTRDTNRYKILVGHATNIPCIAFGQSHLVSTDIAGYTVLWDLDLGKPVAEVHPHHSNPQAYDPSRSGWGLVCLDPRAFRPATTLVTALGACEVAKSNDVFLVDISHSKQLIRNNIRWNAFDIDRNNRHGQPLEGDTSDTETPSTPAQSDADLNDVLDFRGATLLSSATEDAVRTLRSNNAGEIKISGYNNISATDCEDTGCFPLFFSQSGGSLGSLRDDTGPLLLVNPHAVHLLQSADLSLRGQNDPVVYISDPLEQHCRPDLALQLARIDRMNLVAEIPELGVVLIGSAKGRVAVLSLHRLDEKIYSFSDDLSSRPHTYTMRLETILPLSEQEAQGERPLDALAGLAVAPVRGHEGGISKRWRIILTYRDQTVLGYEIASTEANTVLQV